MIKFTLVFLIHKKVGTKNLGSVMMDAENLEMVVAKMEIAQKGPNLNKNEFFKF